VLCALVRHAGHYENFVLVYGIVVVLVLVVMLGFWIFEGENESDVEDEQTGYQGRSPCLVSCPGRLTAACYHALERLGYGKVGFGTLS